MKILFILNGLFAAIVAADVMSEVFYTSILNSPMIQCNFSKQPKLEVGQLQLHCYDIPTNTYVLYKDLDTASYLLHDDGFFNKNKKWHFFLPGFGNTIDSVSCNSIRSAYRYIEDTTLCILDASQYTYNDRGIVFQNYERSVRYSYHICTKFGEFLYNFQKDRVPLENLVLYGHSLGGQCVGYASRAYRDLSGVSLKRASALDPAGPCFNNADASHQIDSTDADFVDIYHCNVGMLGTSNNMGTADFYPNGGKEMTGCNEYIWDLGCSHERCVTMWAESLANADSFYAVQCPSYSDFLLKKCNYSDVVRAGYGCPTSARGEYYLITNKNKPLGLGPAGI